MSRLRVEALERLSIVCADLDRTERFHAGLGFAPGARGAITDPAWHRLWGTTGRSAEGLRMRLGAQEVEFLRFDPPGAPYPAGSTSSDLWFQHLALVVADMDEAYGRLRALAFTAITREGPQRLPPRTGRVSAFKFRDPDGHPLELIHFPDGVGDARWHAPGGGLFRGIDHSAIAVADAAAATRFYRDVLGLRPGTAMANRGPEQDRLDDLDGDVVDVVPLAPGAAATPHVELLGYRTGLRRPASPGVGPADVAATRLVFRAAADGAGPLAVALADGGSAEALPDADGHRLVVVNARA